MAILDSTIIKGDLKVLGSIKQGTTEGVVFSTAEQVYGKWIDGKTIFCKTFQYVGSISENSYFTIGSLNTDISTVVKIDCAIRSSSGAMWFSNYCDAGTSNEGILIRVSTSGGTVEGVSWNENWGSPVLNVTIYYTKA